MIEYRQLQPGKPWRVTFTNPSTGRKQRASFESEHDAKTFEKAQTELAARAREILKRRKAKARPQSMTVNQVLDSYFSLSEMCEKTRKQSSYHARHLRTAFGERRAALLTRVDIANFAEAQRLQGIMQTTVIRRVSILRAALNFAVARNELAVNPIQGTKLSQGRSRRIDPPSLAEACSILENAPDHIRRTVLIGLYAGPRIGPSELFRLTWRDVDLVTGMMRMPNAGKGANAEYRDIPVKSVLLPSLCRWHEKDSMLGIEYVISWNGKPVRSIHGAWRRVLKKAGITRVITPYSLRHAFATNALASGADIGALAAIMGHADPGMILKVYQHVRASQKRQAVELLPKIAIPLELIADSTFSGESLPKTV